MKSAMGLCMIALGLTTAGSSAKEAPSTSPACEPTQHGPVHVSASNLPVSGFLGAETRAVLERLNNVEFDQYKKACSRDPKGGAGDDVWKCPAKHYYSAAIARHRARYKVDIQPETIAGVSTTIVTPADGVSDANRHRVLINVGHGDVESVPIAAVGKIKVVTLDFAWAPEEVLREGVAAVYGALLHDYSPKSIGIYGCSSGLMKELAWMQEEALPAPGAIGVASALPFATLKNPSSTWRPAADVMAQFPDTLFITSTRDFYMSPIVVAHAELVRLGVKADLHVWEGLEHAFHLESDFPESREVYDVIVRFFDKHLTNQ